MKKQLYILLLLLAAGVGAMIALSCKTTQENDVSVNNNIFDMSVIPSGNYQKYNIDLITSGSNEGYGFISMQTYDSNSMLYGMLCTGSNICLLNNNTYEIHIRYNIDIHESIIYTKFIKYSNVNNSNERIENILYESNIAYIDKYGLPPYYDGEDTAIAYDWTGIYRWSFPYMKYDKIFTNNELVNGTFKIYQRIIFKDGDTLDLIIDNIKFSCPENSGE